MEDHHYMVKKRQDLNKSCLDTKRYPDIIY